MARGGETLSIDEGVKIPAIVIRRKGNWIGQGIVSAIMVLKVGQRFMHERLGIAPLVDLQFRLGEGTGAAVAMELLDAATRVLAEIKTFEEVGIGNAQV